MKTILLPIWLGQVTRNFFRTDVYHSLIERADVRFVVVTQDEKALDYKREFVHPRLEFIGIKEIGKTRKEAFFSKLALNLLDVETTAIFQRRLYKTEQSLVKYSIRKFITKCIGNIPYFKRAFRYADYRLNSDDTLKELFDQASPDLVYLPNIFGLLDVKFYKEAKKRGVRTVGLVNSWDNTTSRGLMRAAPDSLIAHNERIKYEASSFHEVHGESIHVVGMPHFDYYLTSRPSPKDTFYARLGITDLNKRIILFSPLGIKEDDIGERTIKAFIHAVKNKELPDDLILLVRYSPNQISFFKKEFLDENVVYDLPGFHYEGKTPNDWEFYLDDMQHLYDTLFYSSVLVNYGSTLSIDIAAFDKPIIVIDYDKNAWWRNFNHHTLLRSYDAARYVSDEKELKDRINAYLLNSDVDSEGRKRLLNDQCWKFDGKSGQRLGDLIFQILCNGLGEKSVK